MSVIPARPEPAVSGIQSADDTGGVYKVVLQDGTILWVPKDTDNADCAQLLAWANETNVEL